MRVPMKKKMEVRISEEILKTQEWNACYLQMLDTVLDVITREFHEAELMSVQTLEAMIHTIYVLDDVEKPISFEKTRKV